MEAKGAYNKHAKLPLVPGHEVIGTISAMGDRVNGLVSSAHGRCLRFFDQP